MRKILLTLLFSCAGAFAQTKVPVQLLSPSGSTTGQVPVSSGPSGTVNWGSASGTTWPTSGDLVLSNGTNSPAGIAEVNGSCAIGSGGVWVAGTCYTLPAATSSTLGGVKPDGTTITNTSGAISCTTATTSQLGCVKPDGTIITDTSGTITVAAATTSTLGAVKTDGATLTNSSGAIACATGTTSQLGCLKPDGSTITVSAGVISSSGGSATTITVGTTTITSGTTGRVEINNSGVLGELAYGLTGNSTLVETTSGGLLTASLLPAATSSTFGGVKPDGTSIANSSGVISLGVSNSNTWTGKQIFNGSTSVESSSFTNAAELVDVIGSAPSSTTNLYVASGSVQYYTSNAANNWTLNLAWSSGTTMNSAMAIGDAVTTTLLVTQGGTAYYATAIDVDGTTTGVTTKWLGGSAPSAGNASGIDAYVCTTIKTASATYTNLCSLSQY